MVNCEANVEADETFVVNLSGATQSTIGDAQGVGTITNDDFAQCGNIGSVTCPNDEPYNFNFKTTLGVTYCAVIAGATTATPTISGWAVLQCDGVTR